MKIKTCDILMIVTVLIFSLGLSVMAQQSDQDQGKMMEAYMKIMAVTENHIYLKERFACDWDVYTTAWMIPGAEPQKAQNSAHAETILGGRFLKVDFKGRLSGQPFEGFKFWVSITSNRSTLASG